MYIDIFNTDKKYTSIQPRQNTNIKQFQIFTDI